MSEENVRIANKVSVVSIVGNVLLAIFKLVAGILANSAAMISDAIHSASDVFSTFIVMIGVKLASKEADSEHPYGHERMECVAAIVLSVILLITGGAIGLAAFRKITGGAYTDIKTPGVLALAAAIASIVLKEAMYWYTRHYAKKIDSTALMASAWDHRSDAFSSIGALIGIAAARMGYPVADPIASLIIFAFIVRAGISIFRDAMDKMVDHACDAETEKKMYECAENIPGVQSIDLLQTRIFGDKIYVDIEIGVDGTLTLTEAHEIAERVHDEIEEKFEKVKHIMVHTNPA
ncbi:MAG: cation diffusion facilitator family transporter [Mogibacterium sp.]|nr:cation diffusion facilitator family transporter [Mogibacterium sp.]